MRKYLRGLAKANMQRPGFNRINRRMRYWKSFATTETTDKSILQALGPAHVRKFKYDEQMRAAKHAERKVKRKVVA